MKIRKILALILSVAMIMSTMGIVASAEGTASAVTDWTANEIVLSSAADLTAFAEYVNSGNKMTGQTVKLGTSIDLAGTEWTPIGNGSRSSKTYNGNAFCGTFDGVGNTISNLTISSGETAGLFGVVVGATIKDFTLENVAITPTNGDNVGAAVGAAFENSQISGITVSGTVSGVDGVGGVVGRMIIEGTISNCINNATVKTETANTAAGGVVGKAYYTAVGKEMTISDCVNNGEVRAIYAAGGIAGLAAANLLRNTNNANITASGYEAGGIVADLSDFGTVKDNVNYGTITANTNVGGIAGWLHYQGGTSYARSEKINVINTTNSGSIVYTGTGANVSGGSGGIVGLVYSLANIADNKNTAESISGENAAGIVGCCTEPGNTTPDDIDITVKNNVSSTPIEKITAYASKSEYSNGSASGVVVENNVAACVAKVDGVPYADIKAAIEAASVIGTETAPAVVQFVAGEFDLGHVLFPSTVKNIIIKGAADYATVIKNSSFRDSGAATVAYENITFDGIAFENSYILFQGWRASATYKDWTITNCKFNNITDAAAVYFNLSAAVDSERMENFTFTNNTISNVNTYPKSGVGINASKGTLTFTGNEISNVNWNAIQVINAKEGSEVIIKDNILSSGADEGVVNLSGALGSVTLENNTITTSGNQPEYANFAPKAKIGNTYYSSVAAAVKDAEKQGLAEVTIYAYDDFKASDIISNIAKVTIIGDDEVVMDVEDKLHVFNNNKYTIKDVVVDGQVAWQGSASNQPIERGLQYVDMTFESCDFNKVLTLYEGTFKFDGCEFTGVNNDYSVYVYASKDVTFKDCVFNAVNKAIKVYSHGNGVDGGKLDIAGSKFYASGTDNVKAVVEMDLTRSNAPKYDIDVNKSIAVGFAEGGAADGKENGNVWYNLEVNATITEEYIAQNITIEKDAESKAYECGDITVVFEPTTVEGEYDIVLKASEGAEIFEFVGAELAFDKSGSLVESGYENKTMNYTVYGIDGKTTAGLNLGSAANTDNVQVYRIHTVEKVRLSGNRVPIGKVVFDGKGKMKLKVVGDASKVITTKYLKDATNDERIYTVSDATYKLVVDYNAADPTEPDSFIDNTASTTKRDVKVNIEFEHDINAQVDNAYKFMTVTLKDSIGNTFTKELADINITGVNSGEVIFDDVTIGVITVTLKAPGFRTYTYQTTMEDIDAEFVLNFWNSVKRTGDWYIEAGNNRSKMMHNFLVGDIAMDYIIDKYDLAAVTSYYGIYDIESQDDDGIKKLVKYDLNRDGDIDILDVAYVLHGMGN